MSINQPEDNKTIASVGISANASAEIKVPFWAPYAKAVVAAILSFLLAFLSALLPFIEQGHVVSLVGWITATIAGIVALSASAGIVYAVPNVVKS
jgi:hydrogenase/urease accessory protein HupE